MLLRAVLGGHGSKLRTITSIGGQLSQPINQSMADADPTLMPIPLPGANWQLANGKWAIKYALLQSPFGGARARRRRVVLRCAVLAALPEEIAICAGPSPGPRGREELRMADKDFRRTNWNSGRAGNKAERMDDGGGGGAGLGRVAVLPCSAAVGSPEVGKRSWVFWE